MASHLSDIGFGVKDKSEFMKFAEKAYENGERIKTNKGTYIRWGVKSGAELWLQLNEQEEVIGMVPAFLGISSRKVSLINFVVGHEGTLDGSFVAWADPRNNDPESGDYPFMFEVPNFHALPQFKFPKITHIQLSAFAYEVTCFDNEEEFNESDKAKLKGDDKNSPPIRFAPESFIPSGSFHKEGASPIAEAMFTGRIIKYENKVNDFTKNPFVWLSVKTLGGEIDIVAEKELFNKTPKVGGIITGAYWLSGRILDSKTNKKSSFISKLFNK